MKKRLKGLPFKKIIFFFFLPTTTTKQQATRRHKTQTTTIRKKIVHSTALLRGVRKATNLKDQTSNDRRQIL
jgi:hypothetical protein